MHIVEIAGIRNTLLQLNGMAKSADPPPPIKWIMYLHIKVVNVM